ncbi:hypothetical protein D3C71_365050 [compost metagenome]
MSSIEILGAELSNPHLRVPVDVNSGVDLTETITNLNRCGLRLGYYSVTCVEMDDEQFEINAGFKLPVEGKSVCFHVPNGQFNLTVSPDNTCVVRTDSTPRLKRVWLMLMMVSADRRVQL